MDTASFQFIAFGLLVAIIVNIHKSPTWRSIIMMIASLVFVGILAHNFIVLAPLLGFLLAGYAALVLHQRGWPKFLTLGIAVVILVYLWLKKYTFIPEGLFLHSPYFTIGLSYIFFRVLHLLIEAEDEVEKKTIGLGAYFLYTLNFTTLISGPIQRYDEFAKDQFAEQPIGLSVRVIGLQLERIVRGFFKVNVLAALLFAFHQDAVAQMPLPLPWPLKLFAAFRMIVFYPFFLYANFSGYIDIVIALARLMRVRLPENFDRPFSASSFLDFWNRWHITLSKWLKTYVYNPLLLALMRRIETPWLQPWLGVVSFFVTFFLVGVWHGRTSEFIFFGVLQGGGVSINKLWQLGIARIIGRKRYKSLAKNFIYIAIGRGLTFSWFSLTLIWFGANWMQIDRVFSALGWTEWICVWMGVWLSATVVLAVWESLRVLLLSIRTADGPVLTNRYALTIYASALGLIGFILTVILHQPAPDIVYKVF